MKLRIESVIVITIISIVTIFSGCTKKETETTNKSSDSYSGVAPSSFNKDTIEITLNCRKLIENRPFSDGINYINSVGGTAFRNSSTETWLDFYDRYFKNPHESSAVADPLDASDLAIKLRDAYLLTRLVVFSHADSSASFPVTVSINILKDKCEVTFIEFDNYEVYDLETSLLIKEFTITKHGKYEFGLRVKSKNIG